MRIEASRRKSHPGHADVDWKAVGRRIRELRGFDMTQEEFAQRIGVSQNYLSTMEHGKVQIGAEILLRIGREFGNSVEWLLTGKA
jgi:transcriptional regulator with XRE-family HTH domain